MSFENLLMILPAGVTSKNTIGENKILFSMRSCNFDDPASKLSSCHCFKLFSFLFTKGQTPLQCWPLTSLD